MADGNRLDRVKRPDARGAGGRDRAGKEALYSVAPSAPPAASLVASCGRCGVERGLAPSEAVRLLAPPFLVNPLRPTRIWTRCPTCSRRAWLHVRPGQVLRGLLNRDSDGPSVGR